MVPLNGGGTGCIQAEDQELAFLFHIKWASGREAVDGCMVRAGVIKGVGSTGDTTHGCGVITPTLTFNGIAIDREYGTDVVLSGSSQHGVCEPGESQSL